MKIRYKDKKGVIIPCGRKGLCAITDSGDIYFPEFLFIGKNKKDEIFCHGAIIIPDRKGLLEIWEEIDLFHSISIYNIDRYLRYEIRMNSTVMGEQYQYNTTRLCKVANNLIREATFRGIYLTEETIDYVKKKEFLNKLGNGKF